MQSRRGSINGGARHATSDGEGSDRSHPGRSDRRMPDRDGGERERRHPRARLSVSGAWRSGYGLLIQWSEGTPGDSPLDEYEVTISTSEAGEAGSEPQTQVPAGSARQAAFAPNTEYPWTAVVRAHNAAGWGPWSSPVTVPGL